MKKIAAAAKLVIADLSQLNKPAVASAIAGVVVPIVASVAGLNITAAEVGGWLLLAGGVAATLQKLEAVSAPAPAPAPVPVAPVVPAPAPVVPPAEPAK